MVLTFISYACKKGWKDDLELYYKMSQHLLTNSGGLSQTLKFLGKHSTLLKCHVTWPFTAYCTTILKPMISESPSQKEVQSATRFYDYHLNHQNRIFFFALNLLLISIWWGVHH